MRRANRALQTMTVDDHATETIGIIVRGDVQAVGFRFFVARTAARIGVAGWVKNLLDDSVEIHATASEFALIEFVDAVRQGPPGSHVTRLVTEKKETPVGLNEGFQILH